MVSPKSSIYSDSDYNHYDYDVFINFRGEDTRNCFVGHLYRALKQRGIRAYLDLEELEIGRSVTDIFDAIDRTRLFITVLSKQFADSSWAMRELEQIVDSHRRIIPIFFDVEPYEVPHLPFYKGIEERLDMLDKGRKALKHVAYLPGYDMHYINEDAAKLIDVVVQEVFDEVYSKVPVMEVAKHPVLGMDTHLQKMADSLLQFDEVDKVGFVGICGIGGIGKTTIAKAAFNKFVCRFECFAFLENVRQRSATRQDGLVYLQRDLIRGLFNIDIDPQITDSTATTLLIIQSIRKRFRKRVLVILDDVDSKDQLHYLVGDGSWLEKGSRVIITTRSKAVLTGCGLLEGDIYTPMKLNEHQSLELFSHFAFMRGGKPTDNSLRLAREVVDSIGGLPSVLKDTASYLSNIPVDKWRKEMGRLKQGSLRGAQSILQSSYDGLTYKQKQIFLDIACFFLEGKLKDKFDNAVYMWEACNFDPKNSLPFLQQKCLVERDNAGRFHMHDEIREMAQEIIRQQLDPTIPREQSRVWEFEGALEIMTRHTKEGLGNVEALLYDLYQGGVITSKSLSAMTNLRMFIGDDIHSDRIQYDFEDVLQRGAGGIPHQILPQPKWLKWPSYPYESLPHQVISPDQLAVLELPNFKSASLMSRAKEFHNLKVLSFDCSRNLVSTPDFSLMPHLEKLILRGCDKLKKISPSIGKLKKLIKLDLSSCVAMMMLPEEMCCCSSLTTLSLYGTAIRELPESFKRLTMLKELDLSKCRSLKELPSTIGSLEQLQELNLEEASVTQLPSSISQLKRLVKLNIAGCPIKILPEEVCSCTSLQELNCRNCQYLSSLPESFASLRMLCIDLSGCNNLNKPPESFRPVTSAQRPFCFEYDVFINFRGEDTRKIFVNHLYRTLKLRGIRAYLDSVDLNKGKSINDLLEAIERSAAFITVFSKRYAESGWCLMEIKKIVDCKRKIFPIFYDVQPSIVRHQKGPFCIAFWNHQVKQNVETVKQWRNALREVATLSGYVLEEDYHGDGGKLIDDVVEQVLQESYKINLEVPEHPVGLEQHLNIMKDLLQTELISEVRFIGICGIAGLGKTTIAKATYNQFRFEFECFSFLAGVRSNAKRGGLVELQKDLIRHLCNDKDPRITDTAAGVELIKRRLHDKKVLIILDDVENSDQLHYLVGDGSHLGRGSRVIITTRNKGVLLKHYIPGDNIYHPKELDDDQSFELFNHFAFKRHERTNEYLQLARQVVGVIRRLPLALMVTGSDFSIVEKEKWRDRFEKLKQLPNQDVQSISTSSNEGFDDEEN